MKRMHSTASEPEVLAERLALLLRRAATPPAPDIS